MAKLRDQSAAERAVKAYALALHADRKARSAVLTKDGEVRVFVQRLPEDESRCGQIVVGQFSELARIVAQAG